MEKDNSFHIISLFSPCSSIDFWDLVTVDNNTVGYIFKK